ncbi:hypothetical protein JKP88DRAFT_304693 [Tribonema minus]|uniref:Uncharacterized protein n=1 Tax=Tribonema minus TaxID=303371 RepID=A0A835Z7F7_9STRA|nr:hypothetical protein JKP88DRAFT_304693 [Tribonema minus]
MECKRCTGRKSTLSGGGIAGASQSSCASLAEDQESQPQTKSGSCGSGGSGDNAHAAAVDEGAHEASTAHAAGGNDVCSGDECSIQSLEVNAGIDRVSQGLVGGSCDEGELNIATGGAHSNGMDSFNSAFICRDSGDHVEGTCDESSEADAGSDASSDAWDPDDNKNCKPARKSARIASLASGTARRTSASMVDTGESSLHENLGSLQGCHASTLCDHEAAEDLRCEQPQLQHLCSVLEENRQLRITIQHLKDDHRVTVEEQHRRLRELEEETGSRGDQHSSQQQATTMEAEPQQLDVMQTMHRPESNTQQRTGIPAGRVAGASQSPCASWAEEQEPQPPINPGGGGGGSDAHAGAVDEGALEASTAHAAGGDDICSGDECSIQSLEVGAGSDRVSQRLLDNSCDVGELNVAAGGTHSGGMDSSNSAFICRESGEHVHGRCDESSEADSSSDASSDAWDPDDNKNCRPSRKRPCITKPAKGTARRCAATASVLSQKESDNKGRGRVLRLSQAVQTDKGRGRLLCIVDIRMRCLKKLIASRADTDIRHSNTSMASPICWYQTFLTGEGALQAKSWRRAVALLRSSHTPNFARWPSGEVEVAVTRLPLFAAFIKKVIGSMVDTRESSLSEKPMPLQGWHTSTAPRHEAAAADLRCEQPQLQHLCSALEENRQLPITIQQLRDDHRVTVEVQHRRLREVEEENRQQRVIVENQRRALQAEQRQWWWQHLVAREQHDDSSQQQAAMATMEAEPQQLDKAHTVHGPEVNSQHRTGIPEGGIAGAGQSTCASLADGQEEQPPTKPGSGGGGGNAHAAAVNKGAIEASTAHVAGGNGVCSGDECSIQSLEVDAGIGSVSQGSVGDSCDGSGLNTATGAAHSDGLNSSNSAFICRDSGEHIEGTCDESSEADAGSDASSDAWEPDDNHNGKPARKSARVTSLSNDTARRVGVIIGVFPAIFLCIFSEGTPSEAQGQVRVTTAFETICDICYQDAYKDSVQNAS